MPLDDVKIKIINALLHNAGRSRKQLSSLIGISESYLSKIIKELVEYDSYIKRFSIEIDYEKAGYSTHAITFITLKNTSRQEVHSVAENIASLNDAVDVYTVFGEWHLCVRWICKTNAIIMENIEKIIESNNIAKIETITLGQQYKRVYGPELI